jgi:hypothetical protein
MIRSAPRERISSILSRNCATCSRQNSQPKWRMKSRTAGCFSQSVPRRTGWPVQSRSSTCDNFVATRMSLDVVPEHQLLGVRIQVHLSLEVRDVVPVHVMTDERERYDEGNEPPPIILDHCQKLVP